MEEEEEEEEEEEPRGRPERREKSSSSQHQTFFCTFFSLPCNVVVHHSGLVHHGDVARVFSLCPQLLHLEQNKATKENLPEFVWHL